MSNFYTNENGVSYDLDSMEGVSLPGDYVRDDQATGWLGNTGVSLQKSALGMVQAGAGLGDMLTNGLVSENYGETLDRKQRELETEYSPDKIARIKARREAIANADGEVNKALTAVSQTAMNPDLLWTDVVESSLQTLAPIPMAKPISTMAKSRSMAGLARSAMEKSLTPKAGVNEAIRSASVADVAKSADMARNAAARRAAMQEAAIARYGEQQGARAARDFVTGAEGLIGAGMSANQTVTDNVREGRDASEGLWSAPLVGATTAAIARGATRFGGGLEQALAAGRRGFISTGKKQTLLRSIGGEASEEAAQAVFESAIPNVAVGNPITQGMGENIAQSAMAGGAMGGGMHAMGAPYRYMADRRATLTPEAQARLQQQAVQQANTQRNDAITNGAITSSPDTITEDDMSQIGAPIAQTEQPVKQPTQKELNAAAQEEVKVVLPRSSSTKYAKAPTRINNEIARAYREHKSPIKGDVVRAFDEANANMQIPGKLGSDGKRDKPTDRMSDRNAILTRAMEALKFGESSEAVAAGLNLKADTQITDEDRTLSNEAVVYKYAAMRLANPEMSEEEITKKVNDWLSPYETKLEVVTSSGRKPRDTEVLKDRYSLSSEPSRESTKKFNVYISNYGDETMDQIVSVVQDALKEGKMKEDYYENVFDLAMSIADDLSVPGGIDKKFNGKLDKEGDKIELSIGNGKFKSYPRRTVEVLKKGAFELRDAKKAQQTEEAQPKEESSEELDMTPTKLYAPEYKPKAEKSEPKLDMTPTKLSDVDKAYIEKELGYSKATADEDTNEDEESVTISDANVKTGPKSEMSGTDISETAAEVDMSQDPEKVVNTAEKYTTNLNIGTEESYETRMTAMFGDNTSNAIGEAIANTGAVEGNIVPTIKRKTDGTFVVDKKGDRVEENIRFIPKGIRKYLEAQGKWETFLSKFRKIQPDILYEAGKIIRDSIGLEKGISDDEVLWDQKVVDTMHGVFSVYRSALQLLGYSQKEMADDKVYRLIFSLAYNARNPAAVKKALATFSSTQKCDKLIRGKWLSPEEAMGLDSTKAENVTNIPTVARATPLQTERAVFDETKDMSNEEFFRKKDYVEGASKAQTEMKQRIEGNEFKSGTKMSAVDSEEKSDTKAYNRMARSVTDGLLTKEENDDLEKFIKEDTEKQFFNNGKKNLSKDEYSVGLRKALVKTILYHTFFKYFLNEGHKRGWFHHIRAAIGTYIQDETTGDVIGYKEELPFPVKPEKGMQGFVDDFLDADLDEKYATATGPNVKQRIHDLKVQRNAIRKELGLYIANHQDEFIHAYRIGMKKLMGFAGDVAPGTRSVAIGDFDANISKMLSNVIMNNDARATLNAKLDEIYSYARRSVNAQDAGIRPQGKVRYQSMKGEDLTYDMKKRPIERYDAKGNKIPEGEGAGAKAKSFFTDEELVNNTKGEVELKSSYKQALDRLEANLGFYGNDVTKTVEDTIRMLSSPEMENGQKMKIEDAGFGKLFGKKFANISPEYNKAIGEYALSFENQIKKNRADINELLERKKIAEMSKADAYWYITHRIGVLRKQIPTLTNFIRGARSRVARSELTTLNPNALGDARKKLIDINKQVASLNNAYKNREDIKKVDAEIKHLSKQLQALYTSPAYLQAKEKLQAARRKQSLNEIGAYKDKYPSGKLGTYAALMTFINQQEQNRKVSAIDAGALRWLAYKALNKETKNGGASLDLMPAAPVLSASQKTNSPYEEFSIASLNAVEASTADEDVKSNAAFVEGKEGGMAVRSSAILKALRANAYDPAVLKGVMSDGVARGLAKTIEYCDQFGLKIPDGLVFMDSTRRTEYVEDERSHYDETTDKITGYSVKADSAGLHTSIDIQTPNGVVSLRFDYGINTTGTVDAFDDFCHDVTGFHEVLHSVMAERGHDLDTDIGHEYKTNQAFKDELKRIAREDNEFNVFTGYPQKQMQRVIKERKEQGLKDNVYLDKVAAAQADPSKEEERAKAEKRITDTAYREGRTRLGDEFVASYLPFYLTNFHGFKDHLVNGGYNEIIKQLENAINVLGLSNNNGGPSGNGTKPSFNGKTEGTTTGSSTSVQSTSGSVKLGVLNTGGSREVSGFGENEGTPGKRGGVGPGLRSSVNGSRSEASDAGVGTESGTVNDGQENRGGITGSEGTTSGVSGGRGESLPPNGGAGSNAGSPEARRNVEATARNQVLSSVSERVRPAATTATESMFKGWLPSMFTRNMVAAYEKFLPSIGNWWRNVLAMVETRRKWQQQVADIVERYKKLSTTDQTSVNNVLTEATRRRFWPYRNQRLFKDDEAWNKYIGSLSVSDIEEYKDFVKKFNSMSDAAKQSVKEALDLGVNERFKVGELVKANDKKAVLRLMKHASTSKRAELKAAFEKRAADINKRLAENTAPYMPFERKGDYVVTYKSQTYLDAVQAVEDLKTKINDSGKPMTKEDKATLQKLHDRVEELRSSADDYIVEFHTSRMAMNNRVAALERQFPDAGTENIQKFEKETFTGGAQPKWSSFSDIIQNISKEMEADVSMGEDESERLQKIMETAHDLFVKTLSDKSAMKSELDRDFVAGYNDNMMENLAIHGDKMSNMLASMEHSWNIRESMEGISKEAREKASVGERDKASIIANEVRERQKLLYSPNESKWAGKAMRAASVWMLLTNPAFYIQNLLQPLMMTAPYINGALGINSAYGELTNTMTAVGKLVANDKTLSNLQHILSSEEYEAIKTARAHQLLTIGINAELGSVEGDGKFAKVTNWMTDKAQTVEIINRVSSYLVAYRNCRKQGMDDTAARKFAENVINQTHGDYSNENAPRLMKMNSAARLATQFRKFQFIQLGLMCRVVKDAYMNSDLSDVEKAIARRQFMWLMSTHFAMAGLKGTPFVGTAMALAAWIFGGAGDDDEDIIRRNVKDKAVSDFLLKGFPKLLGVDMSRKVGAGEMLSFLPFYEFDISKGKQTGYELVGNLAGPSASLFFKALEGGKYLSQGDYMKGLEQLLPYGLLSNGVKAMRIGTQGYTAQNGDVLMGANKFNILDAIALGAGLQTNVLSDRSTLQGSLVRHDAAFDEKIKKYRRQFVEARKNRDSKGAQEALRELGKINKQMSSIGYSTVDAKTFEQALKRSQKREADARGGVATERKNRGYAENLANW